MTRGTGPAGRMLVLAHRGYARNAPDNSLEAFEAAVLQGVDGFETDVRLSSDRKAVLLHDRVTPDGREVATLTQQALSAAFGHPVPALAEALDAWPDVLWMIEVKAPAAAPAVEQALRAVLPRTPPLVTSFHHETARRLAGTTGVQGGVIVAHAPLADRSLPFGLPAKAGRLASVVWKWETLDLPAVERLARAGYRSWVYDVETPDDHARALSLPLAGLVTDRPEHALERSP